MMNQKKAAFIKTASLLLAYCTNLGCGMLARSTTYKPPNYLSLADYTATISTLRSMKWVRSAPVSRFCDSFAKSTACLAN